MGPMPGPRLQAEPPGSGSLPGTLTGELGPHPGLHLRNTGNGSCPQGRGHPHPHPQGLPLVKGQGCLQPRSAPLRLCAQGCSPPPKANHPQHLPHPPAVPTHWRLAGLGGPTRRAGRLTSVSAPAVALAKREVPPWGAASVVFRLVSVALTLRGPGSRGVWLLAQEPTCGSVG